MRHRTVQPLFTADDEANAVPAILALHAAKDSRDHHTDHGIGVQCGIITALTLAMGVIAEGDAASAYAQNAELCVGAELDGGEDALPGTIETAAGWVAGFREALALMPVGFRLAFQQELAIA